MSVRGCGHPHLPLGVWDVRYDGNQEGTQGGTLSVHIGDGYPAGVAT